MTAEHPAPAPEPPPLAPFEVVVRRHGTTVLKVCRAVLGVVDADDAWSETFLAALRAYPDLPPGSDVEAWLVTIAHRKAIDVVRAAGRRPLHVEVVPDVRTAPAADVDLTRRDEVVRALAQLPPGQRRAVAYHHLGGLPHAEVAALTGISSAAARRAASDGRAALRRLLAPPEEPSGGAAGPPVRPVPGTRTSPTAPAAPAASTAPTGPIGTQGGRP